MSTRRASKGRSVENEGVTLRKHIRQTIIQNKKKKKQNKDLLVQRPCYRKQLVTGNKMLRIGESQLTGQNVVAELLKKICLVGGGATF